MTSPHTGAQVTVNQAECASCDYPYGPCCGIAARNDQAREKARDDFGRALLAGLRKDVGDEIVDEMVLGFDESRDPLANTRAALAAFRTQAAAEAKAREEGLLEALEGVLIGGNHLALLIGADHPPATASCDEALEHYGSSDTYEVWCCWRSIMQARAALSASEDVGEAG